MKQNLLFCLRAALLVLLALLFVPSTMLAQEMISPVNATDDGSAQNAQDIIYQADQDFGNMVRPADPEIERSNLPPEGLWDSSNPPGGGDPMSSTLGPNWAGMAQTGTIRPPDPHGAPGIYGVLQTVNLRIQYWNKSGTNRWGPINLTTFFGFGAFTGQGISDPRVVYNRGSSRFFVIMQENTATGSFVNIAISKTNNPAGTGLANWWIYRVPMTQVSGGFNYGGDYPGLGVDAQALYITFNMYKLPLNSSSTFLDNQIIVLRKSTLIAGAATPFFRRFTPVGSANGFTLQPATVIGGNPGNIAYLAETPLGSATTVRIWRITDPIGVCTLLPAITIGTPSNGGFIGTGAPQCATATKVATLSNRTQGNACWFADRVWFCHTAGGSSARAIAYVYAVNTAAMTLATMVGINGGAGVWTYQPSVGVNAFGDVAVAYTQSSAAQCPTFKYVVKPYASAAFESAVTVKTSPSFSNSDRWGDYASVWPDPVDQAFWLTHEWARTNALHNWGTQYARVAITGPFPAPPPPQVDEEEVAVSYQLDQNYPNPFNPTTTIRYALPEDGNVSISVYDNLGQEVATIVNQFQQKGYKYATFDASNIASGMYFYRLQAGSFVETKKLMIMK